MMGKDFGGSIDVMSVASPRSGSSLEEAAGGVGINIVGQYNDWKDPVTWGPVGMSVAIGASAVVAGTATPALIPAVGLYTIPAAGAAGASAVEAIGIYRYHGIDSYINRNQGGLRDDIQQWSAENPSPE